MTTTFEEARLCPKCGQPGKDMGAKPARRRGVMVHTIMCDGSDLCPWKNTRWLVQVNEDGTVPDAYSQVGGKQFPTASPETETRINEALARQIAAETRGDGEVRNPYT
jgi:hypothetical protein